MRNHFLKLLASSLSLLAAFTAVSGAMTAKERADKFYAGYPDVVRDLQYKSVPGFEDKEQLSMDLILPPEKKFEKGSPVVFYIHGGGWSGGERYVLQPELFKQYTDRGIAVACVSYRLAKDGLSALDCLIDCKDATRFLTKNSEKYDLDPNRFGTTGHSAGGHLTLLTAMVPNDHPLLKGDPDLQGFDPKFVCAAAMAPQVTLLNPERFDSPETITMKPEKLEKLIGGKSQLQPSGEELATDEGRRSFIESIVTDHPPLEIAKVLSPVSWLTRDSPPLLVVHGTTDTLIAFRASREFKKLGDERGADVEYIQVENGWHDFQSKDPEKKASHTLGQIGGIRWKFLVKHLVGDLSGNH